MWGVAVDKVSPSSSGGGMAGVFGSPGKDMSLAWAQVGRPWGQQCGTLQNSEETWVGGEGRQRKETGGLCNSPDEG